MLCTKRFKYEYENGLLPDISHSIQIMGTLLTYIVVMVQFRQFLQTSGNNDGDYISVNVTLNSTNAWIEYEIKTI